MPKRDVEILSYASRETRPPWLTRLAPLERFFWPIAIGLFLVVVFAEAGGGWAAAILQLLGSGLLLIVWLVAAYGFGLMLRIAARITLVDPLVRVTTFAAGLGLISLLTLGLGLIGWMNQGVSHGLLGLGIIAFAYQLYRRPRKMSPRVPLKQWPWLLLVPIAAITITTTMLPAGFLWGADEPNGYDVVEYHLQAPREWFEAGKIVPLTHNVFSFFPFNVEMHYLLAMHVMKSPWVAQFLCQMMHGAFIGLTVAAVYAAVADRSRKAALIAALLAASVPWLPMLGSIAYDEGGLLLYGTLAVAWVFRAMAENVGSALAKESEPRSAKADPTKLSPPDPLSKHAVTPSPGTPGEGGGEGSAASGDQFSNEQNPHPTLSRNTRKGLIANFTIAGVMAGLACGSKLTAIPVVLVGTPIAALATLLIHRRLTGRALTGLATMFIVGLLVYSPWMIRNFVWVHNPVFPEMQSTLGRGYYNEAQSTRFDTAHKARPDQQAIGARLAEFNRQVLSDWRFGYALLPIAMIAILVTIRRHDSLFLLFMLLGFAAFWLVFTHLQGRFYVLAIPIAAIAVGRGISQWRSIPALAPSIVLVVVLLGVGFGLEQSQFNQLDNLFTTRANVSLSQLIGMTNYDQSADILADTNPSLPIMLVGEAKAFFYQRPMKLLRYRTVLDVDTSHPTDAIAAWTAELPPGKEFYLWVDPGEIARMHSTYGTPPLPAYLRSENEVKPFGMPFMPPAASILPAVPR